MNPMMMQHIENYIGDSTKLEIEYARKIGKEITYYYTDLIQEN